MVTVEVNASLYLHLKLIWYVRREVTAIEGLRLQWYSWQNIYILPATPYEPVIFYIICRSILYAERNWHQSTAAQWTHDVMMLLLHQNNVTTSFWHNNDFIIAWNVRWGLENPADEIRMSLSPSELQQWWNLTSWIPGVKSVSKDRSGWFDQPTPAKAYRGQLNQH